MKIDRDAFGKFFDGTPGRSWDDYASRLKNAAAGEVDERGYSLADEFEGVAEGRDLQCGCCCCVWTAAAVLTGVGLVHRTRTSLTTWCNLRELANPDHEDRPGVEFAWTAD